MAGRIYTAFLVKTFLFLCVVMLSFTLMAILSSTPSHYGWLPASSLRVNWKLYGGGDINGKRGQRTRRSIAEEVSAYPPPNLSKFQASLLRGLSLQCNHGDGRGGVLDKKYERFLKILEDYILYHQFLTKSATSRTLVWYCASSEHCGGLGDRMKGVVYSLLLAIFSRRRLVVYWEGEGYLKPHMLDWRDPKLYEVLRQRSFSDNRTTYLFQFHSVLNGSNTDISESDMSYYQRIIGSNATNIILSTKLDPSSLLDSHRNGGDPKWIKDGLRWSGLLHLSHSDLDEVAGLVFRYLFRIKDVVFEEVRAAQNVLGLAHSSPYLSLHIRTGFAGMDHVELVRDPKLMQSNEEWSAALKCGVTTADRLLGKDSIIFLATDSNLVKQMVASKYGERIRSLENTLVHLDKVHNFVVSSGEEREGIMVMWVEFILLAQAGIQVRGDGGYSWMAGLLCGIDDSKTVHLDHCF